MSTEDQLQPGTSCSATRSPASHKRKQQPTTRKLTEIWLVGQVSSSLPSAKLPSKREIMALFFHYKKLEKQTVRDSCHSTTNDILELWAKARIPVRLKKHVVDKVEEAFREWEKLKKNKENKKKRSAALQLKEEQWRGSLDDLFDIAHAKALSMKKIQEDKDFLVAQRAPGRRGKIGGVDTGLARREAESQRRQEDSIRRKGREEDERVRHEQRLNFACSSSDHESEDHTTSDKNAEVQDQMQAVPAYDSNSFDEPCSSGIKRARRGRKNIVDEKMAACLDMAKVSDRGAVLVLTPTFQKMGHDPMDYNLNRISVRRLRILHRKKLAEGLKNAFKSNTLLTIHWDGKLLKDIAGRETVARLPVLVSGAGIEQLLAVPKMSSGTGEAAANGVYETAVSWNVCDQVKCMSFDTTAANTGFWKGACILQQKMQKDILWLACRHHIHEIMLEAGVVLSLGVSQGPDILLFKRFQKQWSAINTADYQTALSDETTIGQPRDDYKELLQLTIIFLGGVPPNGISFKAPAGLHRARWMAKALYSLKVWMFRSQFKLKKTEEKGLRDICLFTVRVYIKVWFQAPAAMMAPRLDLQLLKDLDSYKTISAAISAVALKKLMGHLWYLSEELVALALFDDEVSSETKTKMVRALDVSGELNPQKRTKVDVQLIQTKQLEDFVSSSTRRFFEITGLPSSFFDNDVETWNDDDEYKSAKSAVLGMKVVNDVAERGVALMDEYNKLHTNDEEQKQFLLLVVQQYRKKYPDRKKSTLII